MPDQDTDTRHWAQSLQHAGHPRVAPERAMHYGVAEGRQGLAVHKLPADFAERIYEEKVKRTPGLAEGMEHVDKVFEDWKRSL